MLLQTVLSIATALGNDRVVLKPLPNYDVIRFYKNNHFVEDEKYMVYLITKEPTKITRLLSKL